MPSLTKKAELTFVQYLVTQEVLPAGQIHAGESDDEKSYPEVIIEIEQAEEDPPLSGNYWLNVRLIARSNMVAPTPPPPNPPVDPTTLHDVLCEATFNALANQSLSAALTSAALAIQQAFTANGQLPFRMQESPSTDHYETIFEGRIVGMGQAFPN